MSVEPKFERYIGIDYSGAETADSSCKGIRVYVAEGSAKPEQTQPPPSPRRYWTRRGLAEWLPRDDRDGDEQAAYSTAFSRRLSSQVEETYTCPFGPKTRWPVAFTNGTECRRSGKWHGQGDSFPDWSIAKRHIETITKACLFCGTLYPLNLAQILREFRFLTDWLRTARLPHYSSSAAMRLCRYDSRAPGKSASLG